MRMKILLIYIIVIFSCLINVTAKNTVIHNNQQKAIEILLAENVKEIIFARRTPGKDGHWYGNFSYYFDSPKKTMYGNHGGLLCMDIKTKKVRMFIDDKKGAVRDPQLHYDGKKILFSYRKGNSQQYHLYEINTDGSNLKQLTYGIYDDIEPTYLPNGKIAFISSRSKKWVPCWYSQVATLYTCDSDGSNIKSISSNIEQDNTPSVLADGRILFTRWEYVDRSQMFFHHLWTMNPDGTNIAAYFGNMHHNNLFIDAKQIPNTNKIIYIDSPGHGRREHEGNVKILKTTSDPDNRSAAKMLFKGKFRDPYPISDSCFLVATKYGIGVTHKKYPDQIFLLYKGKKALLYHEPIAVQKRKRETIIPDRTDKAQGYGTLIVNNVYLGRNMKGIKPGSIKKLLVVEVLPKPLNFGTERTHDFVPLSWGGTHFMERILGTIPVEADGSAFFKLPSNRALFFIAIDKDGRSVKRMHSFLSVMPGEIISCVGCHEKRNQSPPMKHRLKAVTRPPSDIKPLKYNRYVYDFPRDIQPILDKNCIECHNPQKPSGRVILTGDNGPFFSQSYFQLIARKLVIDGRNGKGNSAPYSVGDSASRLMKIIDGSHKKVHLSEEEREHIRNWINVGAFYPGTYTALGQGMLTGKKRSKEYYEAKKQAIKVIDRSCASCHENKFLMMDDFRSKKLNGWGQPLKPKAWDVLYNLHALYNLTNPNQSSILLAPLAKDAGGWAIGGVKGIKPKGRIITKDSRCPVIFKSKDDPDYKILLKYIEEGKKHLEVNKRWNMPGFKPSPYYIRELKRFGVLPETFDVNKEKFDIYDLDKRYWESLWYYPTGSKKPKHFENKKFNEQFINPMKKKNVVLKDKKPPICK